MATSNERYAIQCTMKYLLFLRYFYTWLFELRAPGISGYRPRLSSGERLRPTCSLSSAVR
jgi:hypothetical protein